MLMTDLYHFDWSDFAFSSKKPLKELEAIFVAAPRHLSGIRFKQLIKDYLPKANILLGISKEPYVLGLEHQPQFQMLALGDVAKIIAQVNQSKSKHKIYTLSYSQRDIAYIYQKLTFRQVLLINGSWYTAFHLRPDYYALSKTRTPFTMLSPFASENEAREYAASVPLGALPASGLFDERTLLNMVARAAAHSYDYGGYQLAAAVARPAGKKYQLLLSAHNQVVPYETYAMHHGSVRERNFSPMHDLNHYDTVHAEMAALVKAQKHGVDLKGTSLFINLLPCPHCARALALTDIAEIVYSQDHSEGYAVQLLEAVGKRVRRVIAPVSV